MNLFEKWLNKRPAVEADDAVFGHITYEHGIWTFVPKSPAEGFMIMVDAPESGPSEAQRGVFLKIRVSLSDFERRARDYLQSRVDPGIDVSRLSVYSVEIGNDDESLRESFVLEMTDEDASIIHRVTFAGCEPVGYEFDD
jgi:hypothetical protein